MLEILGEHRRRDLSSRTSACICWISGSIAPSALFRSCDTLRARSAIACLRSAVTTRARSDSVRCRFWMAIAAWDRKCSTSSASKGFSCPGWRAAILSTPTRPSLVDQRCTQHRRFAKAPIVRRGCSRATSASGPGWLVRPLAPAVALPVEAVDLFRLQQRRAVIGDRDLESDPLALRLRPCDLFRDHAQRRFAVFANEQRRRMIVEGQRSEAVEDLIEEILRMDLHHHLPVDPVAHAEESIAIDSVNGGRQDRSDPRHQAAGRPDRRRGPARQAQSRPTLRRDDGPTRSTCRVEAEAACERM